MITQINTSVTRPFVQATCKPRVDSEWASVIAQRLRMILQDKLDVRPCGVTIFERTDYETFPDEFRVRYVAERRMARETTTKRNET